MTKNKIEPGSDRWDSVLKDGAKVFGIQIDRKQTDQLAVYAEELITWNRKKNLTAITDTFDIAVKHFLDSMAIAPMIPNGSYILDIGSGAGFPGIPLKIIMPSLSFMLIDATRKKINFLRHIIRTLKLDQIDALHKRAEDLKSSQAYKNSFDVIVCRAVTSIDFFVKMALPLLMQDGIMLAMKGDKVEKEIESSHLLSSDFSNLCLSDKSIKHNLSIQIKHYVLPFTKAERSIVYINQNAAIK